MEHADDSPNILVVDDTAANLQLLSRMLKGSGYRVRPVPSGRLALQAALSRPPDLVLLDINMPEMNGYEVCRAFKEHPALKDIPIIFISALNDTENIIAAFDAGGVDFVVKPFQFREVRARVDAHLRIRQLQRELEAANAQLAESLGQQRALELLRDNLVHMLVHDMRSPLMGITTYLQIIQEDASTLLSDDLREDIVQARSCSTVLTSMINDLLDISRMEASEMPLRRERCELADIVKDGVTALGGLTLNHDVQTTGDATAYCDREVITRVITNLIGNAVKFAPLGSLIRVELAMEGDAPRVTVVDDGPGIPPEHRDRIFEKFKQLEPGRKTRFPRAGLGLTYCKLAVEAHGGQIGVCGEEGEGSQFWLTLPPELATVAAPAQKPFGT